MTLKTNKFYIGESSKIIRDNFPDNFVDLTVTSPPYDDIRNYKGYEFDYKEILKELYRVTKIGGVVVWVVGDASVKGGETLSSFKQALYAKEECGFLVHDTMIYEKDSPAFPAKNTANRYSQIFEYMFVFSKGKPKAANLICDKENKWAGQTCFGIASTRTKDGTLIPDPERKNKIIKQFSARNNIWRYPNGYNKSSADKIVRDHPAIFPEKLAKDHILTWSNEGDIVLDPFSGSGTTAKMAFLNNRRFIGIDCSEEYTNKIAIPRLEQFGWKNER